MIDRIRLSAEDKDKYYALESRLKELDEIEKKGVVEDYEGHIRQKSLLLQKKENILMRNKYRKRGEVLQYGR
jgi:hypothetical protein